MVDAAIDPVNDGERRTPQFIVEAAGNDPTGNGFAVGFALERPGGRGACGAILGEGLVQALDDIAPLTQVTQALLRVSCEDPARWPRRLGETQPLEVAHSPDPDLPQRIARGLDDELRGSAFAVVDGIDGRVHHLKLPDIESAGDGPIGGIVELRRFDDARGRQRIALAVRSDLNLEQQVTAEGATWLDRRLVAREGAELSRAGFCLLYTSDAADE